jgi:predicted DNA-binding transcriptional regulator YafY
MPQKEQAVSRSNRMFEIIQLLRGAAQPMTAQELAEALEVVPRTIYRDIAALQATRVPIEGEAGIGYVMRAGFDLPPLMFTTEEVEAIVVGLALLRRTGDLGLQSAAHRVSDKIAAVLPGEQGDDLADLPLYVSPWGAEVSRRVDLRMLRGAIRTEEKLRITYEDSDGQRTRRVVKPLGLLYYIEVVVLTAWCELRRDFRHFRADRMVDCKATGRRFAGEGDKLRLIWRKQHRLP